MNFIVRLINAFAKILLGKIEGYVMLEGLPVANILRSRQEAEEFNAALIKAMRLLKEYSPVSYRRVIRCIGGLHNIKGKYIAAYNGCVRICDIDFPWLVRESSNPVESLAVLLIHESIHALIWKKGIRETAANSHDIELICKRVEYRFWKWLHERNSDHQASEVW
ncbi:MAG: hypothetical protein V4710_16800 [Verrucomicrobiota bacterium]